MIYKEKTEILERAIVFTTYSVKERNKIVNFILEESNGLVSVNIFGFQSKKTSYKAILQPMNIVDLHLIKKKNDNWSIVDVKLVDPFDNLKRDYSKIETILRIFKTIENFPYKQSEMYNRILYKLFLKMMEYCDKNRVINLKILELFFYYYFIYSLGYRLNPKSLCSSCNKFNFNLNIDKSKTITFNYDDGNFLCDNCRIAYKQEFHFELKSSYINISYRAYDLLHKLSSIKFINLSSMNDYKIDDILFRELKSIYEFYLRYHLNKKIYL